MLTNYTTKNYFLIPNDQLPDEIKYGLTNTVVITVYSLLLAASFLVNSVFLVILIRRRHRTRTHYLMINLCLSNFYLVLVEMPLQIGWNATVYWAGSEALCRAVSYFSIIGLYGNAFFTVAIALDRWQSISKVASKNSANQNSWAHKISRQRTCLTIVFAWTMAHICSIPQAIIYHIEEHPAYKNYHQCVTFNYFPSQLEEIAYNICVSCLIYLVPLFALICCSLAIWLYIRDHAYTFSYNAKPSSSPSKDPITTAGNNKRNNRNNNTGKAAAGVIVAGSQENNHPRQPSRTSLQLLSSTTNSTLPANRLQDRSMRFRCSTKRLLCRAEKQAFKLTVVFLTIFIACHTPYQIIAIWRVMNPSLGERMNPIVHRLLFACGVLPTVVDPIAYAKFLIPITNELKVIIARRRRSSTSCRRVRSAGNTDSNNGSGVIVEPEVELTKSEQCGQQMGLLKYTPPQPQDKRKSSISSSRLLLQIQSSAWM